MTTAKTPTPTPTPTTKPRAPSKYAIELLEYWRDLGRYSERMQEPLPERLSAPLPPEYTDHQQALEGITGLEMLRLVAMGEQAFAGRLGQLR